jgi:hypothetical protein
LNEFDALGSGVEAGVADAVADRGRDQGGDQGDGTAEAADGTAEAADGAAEAVDATAEAPTESEEAGPADVIVDEPCPNAAQCTLRVALVHRYAFDGTGSVVTDSIGGAHGRAVGAQLTGTGSLVLAGGSTDQYVDLPNGIIHPLSDATFEVWLTWSGGAGWQRIFDFGSSNGPEGSKGGAVSTLFLTPDGAGPGGLIGEFSPDERQGQTYASSGLALPTKRMVQVAFVIDQAHQQMILYRNGQFEASEVFLGSLSMLNDVNNWLGRSQYAVDTSLAGTLHEFRIYGAALSPAMLQESFVGGTDPPFLN